MTYAHARSFGRTLLLVTLWLVPTLAVPAHAESRGERALAEELLALMGVEAMSQQALDELIEAAPPGDTKDAKKAHDEITALMRKTLSWKAVEADYVAIYTDLFDESELRGFVAFFKGPVGRKYVEASPELTRRSMEVGAQRLQAIMPQLQPLLRRLEGAGTP
jgi:hypothetical protein